ncbi:hypothetical protein E3P92_01677 [Wallemia ichthyophaga]|uniref:Alpha/beta hydrolase fold-3 domain-containing protein n=1 Tax=Wallemia ichthyophaga TaxID=245174 RepID=A0A4V4LR95_WALIC|nr:hypothetical protein E3P91_01517 [Wallemia ichthyophaga]TIA81453.1 hypothetical protein E3P98_02047 [Wallemia ichthyophaga]TIA96231.1 hypothetical protein E3P95_03354 [Wallemia ichthyophaga]TIA99240.1 hypothetical protein E3P94_02670 [Wallemia ichthyophaga]TIB12102.1 hypothetical protein E3P90_02203 [Wallemia ichthyophaga]
MTQPIKYIYIFGVCLSIALLSPIWALIDYPLSNRPNKDWPLSRCIRIRAFRMIEPVIPLCAFDRDLGRIPTEPPYAHLLKRSKFTYIPPLAEEYISGWLRNLIESVETLRIENETKVGVINERWLQDYTPKLETCRPIQIPCYVYFDERVSPAKASTLDLNLDLEEDDKVMLQFHGGGYIVGSAHENDVTATLCKDFIKFGSVKKIFSVDYRLAWYAPFPAALIDAISSWSYLVNQLEIKPHQIVFSGDSAGANLALALTRYLIENELPGPSGLVLHSPWSDMTFSRRVMSTSFTTNKYKDILESTFSPYAVKMLTRYVGVEMINSVYLSPMSQRNGKDVETFKQFPSTFIIAGECEMLLDECVDLHESMIRSGVGCRLHIVGRGVHDPAMFSSWQEPERSEMFYTLASWIDGLFGVPKPDYGDSNQV